MTHPGEQYYPQGVRWDDPIARGTLPDLLPTAAAEYRRPPRASNSATGRSRYRRTAGAGRDRRQRASCAPATARTARSRMFLGNSPDHPVNFFGALKAGARVVHLSPLDGEIALSHKLTDSGARVLVTSNLVGAAADRAEVPRQGPARSPDRLRGRRLGQGRHAADARCRTIPPSSPTGNFIEGARKPTQWPAISADDVALLQYTGGTTGLPKGAMLEPRQSDLGGLDLRRLGRDRRALERNAIERVICVLPLFHIYALTVVLLSSHPARQSDLAAPALRCRGRDARYRGQARHRVPRRAHHVDRHRRAARSRQARSVLAGQRRARAARRCRSRSRASWRAGSA